MKVRAALTLSATVAAAVLLAACASGSARPKPAPLEPLVPTISAPLAWSQQLGGEVKFPLQVAVNKGVYTVANSAGSVVALQADSGQLLWRAEIGSPISAGVGSDGQTSAVVTGDGELVALQGSSVKWRQRLTTRVVTAPLVAGERVFVLGVDRAVQAFDAADGHKLWTLQRPGDPLTLGQSGVIMPFDNTLLVGQGPRLAAVDPLAGTVRWEAPLATPRGANEVERLADLVGPALRVGDAVCARAYDAAVGCVDVAQGRLRWNRSGSGSEAIGGDAEHVFGSDNSDRMTAWRTANGDVVWSSDALLYRGLSAPASVGASVVYGDEQGMLHWLSVERGQAQLRSTTDGSAIVAQPALAGRILLVVTRAGGVFAFRTP